MPLWSGHISFGLVSVPVSLVTATAPGTTPLHLVHTAGDCFGRIRYRKICELDGQTVTEHEIGRGYELPSGTIVPLSDDELDHLPLATARTIELVGVLPASRIDPRQIGAASYFLAASSAPAGAKPYVLLVQALTRRLQVAVVKFASRGDRERLGMLRPYGDVLVLNALRWGDEVRSPAGLPAPQADVGEDEIAAALDLIDARSVDSLDDIPDLVDHYAQALAQLIDAKIHDRSLEPPAAQARGQLVDLMAALQQSVDDARASRGE